MHIAVDARTISRHFPGIGRSTYNLLRALQNALGPSDRLTALVGQDGVIPDNVRSSINVRATPFSLRQQWLVPWKLRQLGADVYHSPYLVMPYLPGRPTVVTIHDLIPHLFPQYTSRRARLTFKLALEAATRAAALILVNSAQTRDDLLAATDLPGDRIRVTRFAADPRFRPVAGQEIARVRGQLGLPERYVLYVGSNKPHKNIEGLVNAWSLVCSAGEVKERTFVFAGRWSNRYPNPQEQVARLGLADRVLLLADVEDRDLPALFGGAELFLFPSFYEGFGLPILEAMACGTPVACSQIASLPEVGGDAAAYFDPHDEQNIAATIRRLIEHADERAMRAQAGIAQARQFCWQSTARLTLAAYRDALTR